MLIDEAKTPREETDPHPLSYRQPALAKELTRGMDVHIIEVSTLRAREIERYSRYGKEAGERNDFRAYLL